MVLALAVWAMLWAIRTRQFDNLDAQAWSVVLDDDSAPPPDEKPLGGPDDKEGEE